MTADGWAFLVARGRRQGFGTRLVPGVLRQLGVAGIVEEHEAHGDGQPTVSAVPTPHGRVTIVARRHRITADDLPDAAVGPAADILDEHGRPLDITYGFVCVGMSVTAVHEADMWLAHQQAMQVYHQFRSDESAFTTQVSQRFPLRSTVAPLVVPRPPVPAGLRHRQRRVLLAVGGGLMVATCAIASVLALVRDDPVPPHTPPTLAAESPRHAIPPALMGDWRGAADPDPRRGVTITIECPGSCSVPDGATVGHLSSGECTYELRLGPTDAHGMRLTVKGTDRPGCVTADSVLQLREATPRTATLQWYDKDRRLLLELPVLGQPATPGPVPS